MFQNVARRWNDWLWGVSNRAYKYFFNTGAPHLLVDMISANNARYRDKERGSSSHFIYGAFRWRTPAILQKALISTKHEWKRDDALLNFKKWELKSQKIQKCLEDLWNISCCKYWNFRTKIRHTDTLTISHHTCYGSSVVTTTSSSRTFISGRHCRRTQSKVYTKCAVAIWFIIKLEPSQDKLLHTTKTWKLSFTPCSSPEAS